MSLRREADGTIVLFDSCPVDEAEPLHRLLLSDPAAQLDWTKCNHLHTAILQLLLAVRPVIIGPCGDPFVDRWFPGKSLETRNN
jgi:hypothetical protein